jgi:restriction system protein
MNFKMREKSLFAVLLRSPWWVSVLIAAAVAAVAAALLPAHLVPFGVAGCFPFVVIACMAAWKQRNAIKPERVDALLAQASAMPWRDFCAKLIKAYEAQGAKWRRCRPAPAEIRRCDLGQCQTLQSRQTRRGGAARASPSPRQAIGHPLRVCELGPCY